MQADVERKLLGARVDRKYPPDRNDGRGQHWVTQKTQDAQLRKREHERERGKEKDLLESVLQPGGLSGLERARIDPSLCVDDGRSWLHSMRGCAACH